MLYRIEFKRAAKKELAKLPKNIWLKTSKTIEFLANNPRPHGVKALQGNFPYHRIRIGRYRIVYQIIDDLLVVLVIRVGPRQSVYTKLPRS